MARTLKLNPLTIMKKTHKFKSLILCCVAAVALPANAAMIIQYDFEGNTAEITTNDLASLGVTAGDIETST